MRLHVLSGLPRSGSTLFANLLAQHPDVHVSGTSAMGACMGAVTGILSNAAEVQSDLANVAGAYDGYLEALRGFAAGWYSHCDEAVVIDKGRAWITHHELLRQLYPGAVNVVMVRDPREVVASMERHHVRTALFNSPVAPTLYERADLLLKQDGMVGGPVRFCEDLVRRNARGAVFVRYESFVRSPVDTVEKVADAMGLDAWHHWDPENIENVATDLDALYRGKYPHNGCGSIKVPDTSWHDVMDESLANLIAGTFPLYMQTWGYT